jgi:hypothetical protein
MAALDSCQATAQNLPAATRSLGMGAALPAAELAIIADAPVARRPPLVRGEDGPAVAGPH